MVESDMLRELLAGAAPRHTDGPDGAVYETASRGTRVRVLYVRFGEGYARALIAPMERAGLVRLSGRGRNRAVTLTAEGIRTARLLG